MGGFPELSPSQISKANGKVMFGNASKSICNQYKNECRCLGWVQLVSRQQTFLVAATKVLDFNPNQQCNNSLYHRNCYKHHSKQLVVLRQFVWGKTPVQKEYLHGYQTTWEKEMMLAFSRNSLWGFCIPNLGPRALRALEKSQFKQCATQFLRRKN